MKRGSRFLAVVLAVAMLVVFMPILAFADGEEVKNEWVARAERAYYDLYGTPTELRVIIEGTPLGEFTYLWKEGHYDAEQGKDIYTEIEGAAGSVLTITDVGYKSYQCIVTDSGTDKSQDVWFYGSPAIVSSGGLIYQVIDADTARLYGTENDELLPESITIPSSVKFDDGRARTVTVIDEIAILGSKYTSATIPETVTDIGKHAVGYYIPEEEDTELPVSNFVIYGAAGSAAEKYAAENGFTFVSNKTDPTPAPAPAPSPSPEEEYAAKIAAWNGTLDLNIPSLKSVKKSAGKKKFTVKWKELTKKQLKRSKVTNIEIQYSLNPSFPMSETETKLIGKKKTSYKVRCLQPKMTYYVRVRAIRNEGGVKYVGNWTTKKVKVK